VHERVRGDRIHAYRGSEHKRRAILGDSGEVESTKIDERSCVAAPVAQLDDEVGAAGDRTGIGPPAEHSEGLSQRFWPHHLADGKIHGAPAPLLDSRRAGAAFQVTHCRMTVLV